MQWLERDRGHEVGPDLRGWIFSSVIVSQKETKQNQTLCWSIWVVTVNLLEAVSVFLNTGLFPSNSPHGFGILSLFKVSD